MKSCPVLSSRPGGTVQTPFLSEYQLTGYSYFGTYRNDRASHGVVLGSIYTSMRWRLIALMGNGEVWEPLPDDTMFEIPLFISIDLVSRCGKAEITNHKPELMARVDVLKTSPRLFHRVRKREARLPSKDAHRTFFCQIAESRRMVYSHPLRDCQDILPKTIYRPNFCSSQILDE